ncbi:unnamed protein product [Parascedosporium putredinis]|uniref:Uncharacterized protein n=1 Tax=Parascedosporium putredinis TaxID=1442378 RepID=A0A9P1H2T7_9PEZI|nr:unnamed protein product [Parascedosporium putredinis]CAI7993933.1 unnamed protein product [Parascedosporium putredinis]
MTTNVLSTYYKLFPAVQLVELRKRVLTLTWFLSWEIEVTTDSYGDSQKECAAGLNSRMKVLCCRPPANLNPFLPVPLENLFPTLPPATNLPNFDLQYIDPPPTLLGQDSNQQAFGMVVIDGPPSAVTTLSKRDGSHIQFVDCDSTEKHDLKVYRARYLCMRDSEDSNCNNVHLGGASGTIVKLPEECGYATYGVVHDIRPADNTSIPNHLEMLAPADSATDIWKSLISEARDSDLVGGYWPKLQRDDFESLIYEQDGSDDCGGSGFLSIKLSGTFEEAYGYFDSELDLEAKLEVAGQGMVQIPGALGSKSLFNLDVSGLGFSHPGIVRFTPNLNIDVDLLGDGALDGPYGGNILGTTITDAFQGQVSGTASTTGTSADILAVELNVRSWMDVSVFELGTNSQAAKAQFVSQIGHYVRVTSDGDNIKVIDSDTQVSVEAFSAGISATWEADDQAYLVGSKGSPAVLYSGAGEDPDDNKPPNWNGSPLFDDEFVSCLRKWKLDCFDSSYLVRFDADLADELDEGWPFEKRSNAESRALDPRGTGEGREFTVQVPGGSSFKITSHKYPNGDNGRFLLAQNPDAGYFALLDPENCEVWTFTSKGSTDLKYVSEHIVELSYMVELLRFAVSGQAVNRDKSIYSHGILGILTEIMASHAHPTMSPLDEMWEAFGSVDNPEVMVNAETAFNGIKMRTWRGIDPVSESKWKENEWHDTSPESGMEHTREALSAIRTVISVFDYLNHRTISENMDTVFNRITDVLMAFDEAVLRIRQLDIGMTELHQGFIRYYLAPRIEGVEDWVMRRLGELEVAWETELANDSRLPAASRRGAQIRSVLQAIKEMTEGAETDIMVNFGGIDDSALDPVD